MINNNLFYLCHGPRGTPAAFLQHQKFARVNQCYSKSLSRQNKNKGLKLHRVSRLSTLSTYQVICLSTLSTYWVIRLSTLSTFLPNKLIIHSICFYTQNTFLPCLLIGPIEPIICQNCQKISKWPKNV